VREARQRLLQRQRLLHKRGLRYVCNQLRQQGELVCQRLSATPLDERDVRWFFEALSTAAIDLSARTLAEADAQRATLFAARRQQLQHLRYAANRAERHKPKPSPN
jgi:hypothetical protein